jgi:hypothetical protein
MVERDMLAAFAVAMPPGLWRRLAPNRAATVLSTARTLLESIPYNIDRQRLGYSGLVDKSISYFLTSANFLSASEEWLEITNSMTGPLGLRFVLFSYVVSSM